MSLIKHIALLCVHTSPLAALGGKKTGGMNVYVRELAIELSHHGIKVDIYTRYASSLQPEVDSSLGDDVNVIHVSCGPKQVLDPDDVYPYLSQFTASVIAYATKKNVVYDLIYSHYWLSGWVANKLKEVWNIPFVHMFHTLGHMKQRIGSGATSLPDVRIITETQIVNWASRIIAATPAEHAQLRWLYRANRKKITIVPPGVDADNFFPIPQNEARKQLHIDEHCSLLLFVGRIEPLKAVDMILEALNHIRSNEKQLAERICFVIIGGNVHNSTDAEMQRLRVLVDELGLGGIVEFLGAKNHDMLPTYYAAATVVIVPSDYESFGMVALEAMAAGTPVIASEVGGLAFLVRDHETGFLVPVRDSVALAEGITTLLTEPERQKLLGQNAIALAQEYSWNNVAQKLIQVFIEVKEKPITIRHTH